MELKKGRKKKKLVPSGAIRTQRVLEAGAAEPTNCRNRPEGEGKKGGPEETPQTTRGRKRRRGPREEIEALEARKQRIAWVWEQQAERRRRRLEVRRQRAEQEHLFAERERGHERGTAESSCSGASRA